MFRVDFRHDQQGLSLIASALEAQSGDIQWHSDHVFEYHSAKFGHLKGRLGRGMTAKKQLQLEAELTALISPKDVSPRQSLASLGETHLLLNTWIEGETLSQLVRSNSPPVSWHHDIEQQLQVLHRAGYVHGDIKPGNIVIGSDGHATLIDLSMAIRIGCSLETLPFHYYSPSYSPPQQIDAVGNIVPLLDWYALAICYCAAHRAHPYEGLDITQHQTSKKLTFFSHCRTSYQRIITHTLAEFQKEKQNSCHITYWMDH
ncbi:protein kinase domain-containing protein [Vibrio mediterranei]